jgi:hypothetical protein
LALLARRVTLFYNEAPPFPQPKPPIRYFKRGRLYEVKNMKTFIISLLLKLRWVYFHVHPWYVKIYLTETESHFYHKRTNTIHHNYSIK